MSENVFSDIFEALVSGNPEAVKSGLESAMDQLDPKSAFNTCRTLGKNLRSCGETHSVIPKIYVGGDHCGINLVVRDEGDSALLQMVDSGEDAESSAGSCLESLKSQHFVDSIRGNRVFLYGIAIGENGISVASETLTR